MIEFILALAALNEPNTAPHLVSSHRERSACMTLAEKRNRTDEDLRTVEARVKGLEYVCLKIERVRV
jgi:hypothetical protein